MWTDSSKMTTEDPGRLGPTVALALRGAAQTVTMTLGRERLKDPGRQAVPEKDGVAAVPEVPPVRGIVEEGLVVVPGIPGRPAVPAVAGVNAIQGLPNGLDHLLTALDELYHRTPVDALFNRIVIILMGVWTRTNSIQDFLLEFRKKRNDFVELKPDHVPDLPEWFYALLLMHLCGLEQNERVTVNSKAFPNNPWEVTHGSMERILRETLMHNEELTRITKGGTPAVGHVKVAAETWPEEWQEGV